MTLSAATARCLGLLPCGMLLAVGLLQLVLAHAVGLSAWSGGGFGMFSTTDAGATRHLHAFVIRPGIVREVLVPPRLADRALRARTLPSRPRLRALALELAQLPSPDEGAPTALRLQVWRTRYDPATLAPSSRILRALELDLAAD